MGLITFIKPLSTFLLPALLINLSNSKKNFFLNFFGTQGTEPWLLGEKQVQCSPPPPPQCLSAKEETTFLILAYWLKYVAYFAKSETISLTARV